MTSQSVTDIDSLPNMVRNLNSRRLIDDAIAAYRGDALRSAIVSTWNAIVNDIIAKTRELVALEDIDAIRYIERLDEYIEDEKIGEIQRLERDILKFAEKKIKIINSQEARILNRIKEDRHMCAHPAFVKGEKTIFQPSPDLVRSHIVSALQCLLICPPLQGHSVLVKFKSDVVSTSFPSTYDSVKTYVNKKYLSASKETLIENMIIEILRIPFSVGEDEFARKRHQLAWTLSEISLKKPDIFLKVAQSFISQQNHISTEQRMLGICVYLGVEPIIWSWLSDPIKLNLIEIIKNANAADLIENFVFDAYYIPDLSQHLANKISSLYVNDQITIISNHPYKEFIALGISIYQTCGTYEWANFVGNTVIERLASQFEGSDVIRLLGAVKQNGNICYSVATQDTLAIVFDATNQYLERTRECWKDLVETMTQFNQGNQELPTSYPKIRSRLYT